MNNPSLRVHTPQGESGSVLVSANDYLFRYSDNAQAKSAVSLTMPVRAEEYRRRELHPIFQMNLPEGYVLEQLRNRLAKTVKVDPMLLLALSGSSAPIGRVFVASDQVNDLIQRNGPPTIGENLDEILAWDGAENLFAELVDRYILRAGISGVQPKVLVPERPQTPEQKYTKSYAAIAKAVRVFCSPEQHRSSLDQLFDSVALSCIVGNGDAHLKNFGVLYGDPLSSDTRLAPAYDIVNTTAYIPEDSLALDLDGSKSLFASRLGILEFARTCEVENPEARIQALLQTLEVVLKREDEYCRSAPDVAKAIRQSAQGFQLTFGG